MDIERYYNMCALSNVWGKNVLLTCARFCTALTDKLTLGASDEDMIDAFHAFGCDEYEISKAEEGSDRFLIRRSDLFVDDLDPVQLQPGSHSGREILEHMMRTAQLYRLAMAYNAVHRDSFAVPLNDVFVVVAVHDRFLRIASR